MIITNIVNCQFDLCVLSPVIIPESVVASQKKKERKDNISKSLNHLLEPMKKK